MRFSVVICGFRKLETLLNRFFGEQKMILTWFRNPTGFMRTSGRHFLEAENSKTRDRLDQHDFEIWSAS